MIFWETFLESVKLPSKKALFKLNRTGMDIVVIYMFFLIIIVSIPSLVDQLIYAEGLSKETNVFFILIFFFIFHVLPLNIIVFVSLSLLSLIFLGITKLMQRKLRFAILWKMAAYTTTVPFIIYTLLALYFPIPNTYLWVSLLYTVILLIKMISIYPKRRQRME